MPLSPPTRTASLRERTPSPRHPDVQLPPDGWIPTAGRDSFISIPPPHELSRMPEASDADSMMSRDRPGPSEPSPSVRARDFAFEPSREARQRPTSLDSQGSTIHSRASTTVSQMDLVSPPNTAARRPNKRGLSVIPEDVSAQPSPNSSVRERFSRDNSVPFPPLRAPDFAAAIGRTTEEASTDSPAQLMEARMKDQRINQRIADGLRYSDPDLVETWRQNGADQVSSFLALDYSFSETFFPDQIDVQ